MLIDLVLEREIEPGKVFDLTLPLADVADRGSLASRLMLRLWRPGSAGVFVVIHTISASRLYISVIATRLVDTSASSKMWLRVRRILGGSINFSVTFVAVPCAALKEGARMTDTAGIPGDRICSFIERVEHIDEEIKALNEGKKEVFAEAKGEGFDVKVLKEILRLRKQDKGERDEQDSLLDLYLRAMESAGSSQAKAA
jgi:uncharacterized protein (UPF0335 family)